MQRPACLILAVLTIGALAAALAEPAFGAAQPLTPFEFFQKLFTPPAVPHHRRRLRPVARPDKLAVRPAAPAGSDKAGRLVAVTPPEPSKPPPPPASPAPTHGAAEVPIAPSAPSPLVSPVPAVEKPVAIAAPPAPVVEKPLALEPQPEVPIPPPRPAKETAAVAGETPPDAGEPAPIPEPRLRPKLSASEEEKLAMIPPPAVVAPLEKAIVPAEECGTALTALNISAVSMPSITTDRCAIATPIRISSFEKGAVRLEPKAITNCAIAETLAAWLRDDVEPAAAEMLKGKVTSLRVAASFDCRNRDNLPGEKLSEHAFGNAIDISGFEIDGKRWIEIGGDKKDEVDDARFLDAVRHKACARFTTVLGPGQPYHDKHFHLDLGVHGQSGMHVCE